MKFSLMKSFLCAIYFLTNSSSALMADDKTALLQSLVAIPGTDPQSKGVSIDAQFFSERNTLVVLVPEKAINDSTDISGGEVSDYKSVVRKLLHGLLMNSEDGRIGRFLFVSNISDLKLFNNGKRSMMKDIEEGFDEEYAIVDPNDNDPEKRLSQRKFLLNSMYFVQDSGSSAWTKFFDDPLTKIRPAILVVGQEGHIVKSFAELSPLEIQAASSRAEMPGDSGVTVLAAEIKSVLK